MALWLSSLLVLYDVISLCRLAEAAYYNCYSTGNFTIGSDYGNSRDASLKAMATNVKIQNGFYHSHTQLYCLGLCRADLIGSDACSACVTNSSWAIIRNCPVQMEVIAWGADAGCLVRCAPHDFTYSTYEYESQPAAYSCNASEVQLNHLPQFGNALAKLTSSVAERAAEDGSKSSFECYLCSLAGDFPNYFATEELNGDVGLTIYALGLCLPTLSRSSCVACLRAAGNESERLCNGRQGATFFTPSCIFRYELYRFYESSSHVSPLPAPPPPSSPVLSPSHVGKEGINRRTIATAVVIPVVMIIVLTLTARIVYNIWKITKQKGADEDDEIGADSTESYLEFSLDTIRVATNNFSTHNKLGQGGFGAVYKGSLPDGQQIAVKRLTVHSARGDAEFKNEVQLVARLHHKNLIRLIGFCLHRKERILIYELALNRSLDHFLFDPIRREQLDWKIRFHIIEGIARGMLYLHDESQLRIIHRDLKAGNILLDGSMNAKISDFGTARLFVEDQSIASRIVGTYGYMAPEYVKHGKISVKIDVFSFGVLLLEIVCGKKNSTSENQNHIEHLLSKVWQYWTTRKLLKLIDPVLLRASGQMDELARCIHIGLLCVQEDATCRPTMKSVILMLKCCSQILPPPQKPAYFMLIKDDQDCSVSSEPDSAQQTNLLSLSSSGFSSVNEVSITWPYPEPR